MHVYKCTSDSGIWISNSQVPTGRVVFTHELDSHNSFDSVDSGTFVTLPNGNDLEQGSMPRPDIPGNPVTQYEEIWRELTPFPDTATDPGAKSTDNTGISYILDSETIHANEQLSGQQESSTDHDARMHVTRTFLGRSCGIFLALRQTQTYNRQRDHANNRWIITHRLGGEVSARREEWGSSGWHVKYTFGPDGSNLPSKLNTASLPLDGEGKGLWRVEGQTVEIGGESYVVRAFESK